MPGNTRRNTRVQTGVPASLQAAEGAIRGTLQNLSRGGMFFLSNRMLPVGQAVQLQIELPGSTPVQALGEVRYHHRNADGVGMGIRFLRLDGPSISFISQFVDARIAA